MALVNSYYPLLDLDIAQRGTISTSRHYLEISAQGYKGPDNLCVIRRGGGVQEQYSDTLYERTQASILKYGNGFVKKKTLFEWLSLSSSSPESIEETYITNNVLDLHNYEDKPKPFLVYCSAKDFNGDNCLKSLMYNNPESYNLDVNNKFNCIQLKPKQNIYDYRMKFKETSSNVSDPKRVDSLNFAMLEAQYPGCYTFTKPGTAPTDTFSLQLKFDGVDASYVTHFTIWMLIAKKKRFSIKSNWGEGTSDDFGYWDSNIVNSHLNNTMFHMPLRLTMPIMTSNGEERSWDYELICFEREQERFNSQAWCQVRLPNRTPKEVDYEIHVGGIHVEFDAQAPKTYEEFIKRAKDLNVNRLKFCDNAEDTDMYLDIPWPSWAK